MGEGGRCARKCHEYLGRRERLVALIKVTGAGGIVQAEADDKTTLPAAAGEDSEGRRPVHKADFISANCLSNIVRPATRRRALNLRSPVMASSRYTSSPSRTRRRAAVLPRPLSAPPLHRARVRASQSVLC